MIDFKAVLNQTFDIEADAIAQALKQIDQAEFEKALDILYNAKRIGCSGCGHSGIICMHFAHLMRCINLTAAFLSPAEALHGAIGFLKEGDVIVLASRGGKTKELLPIIDVCKKEKIKIIGITENLDSEIAKSSDAVIKMSITRETDKWNSQGTTSSTVLAVIFHALQSALIEMTGFKNEQFAVIHPHGAVGERLNKK